MGFQPYCGIWSAATARAALRGRVIEGGPAGAVGSGAPTGMARGDLPSGRRPRGQTGLKRARSPRGRRIVCGTMGTSGFTSSTS
jgi:hypothetical protein